MSIYQIAIIFVARWRLALLVFTSIVAVVVAISLLLVPQFTAQAAVILDVKSPDPIAGVVLPGLTTASYMGTQLGVIQSERVMLRAIDHLQLDKRAELQQRWQEQTDGRGDYRAWLAARLLRKLDVTPTRDSNILTIAYTAPDANDAAVGANAVVRAYIETTADLRKEPATEFSGFFETRAKVLRSELEIAQTRLSSFQQKNGIVASDERVDTENLRLTELSSKFVALQGVASESSSREKQASRNSDYLQEVLNNPLLTQLNAELAKQESRVSELSSRLGENNPQLAELRSNVGQMRSRIQAETVKVAASLTVDKSVDQARLGEMAAAIEQQKIKIFKLKGQRDELGVLLRDVENAQRAYDQILARAGQSSVESQATPTNVSILKDATAPADPSFPRMTLNLPIGILLGFLLAVAAVMIRETADRRLRTVTDVDEVLQQPVLGVLAGKSAARSIKQISVYGSLRGMYNKAQLASK